MSGLITAFNIAYQQKETRGFFKFNLIAIGLTVGMLLGGTVIIALVGVLPAAIQFLGLGALTKWLLLVLEWPLLIVVVMAGLAVLYRYAPNRQMPRWRWVSPGAIAATVLWVAGSIGFTVYVTHFNSYDKTYGALGGVVIMLTWLYLSSFVALFGAVINAQSERQTVADLTVGHPKPLGDRRAYAADTVGEATSMKRADSNDNLRGELTKPLFIRTCKVKRPISGGLNRRDIPNACKPVPLDARSPRSGRGGHRRAVGRTAAGGRGSL